MKGSLHCIQKHDLKEYVLHTVCQKHQFESAWYKETPNSSQKKSYPQYDTFTFKLVDFLFAFNLRKRLAASVCTSEPPFNGVSGSLLKATCQPAKSNGLRGNPRLKQLLPCWGSIQRLALGSQVSLRKHIEQLPPRAKPLTKVVEKHLSGGTRMLNAGGKR